MFGTKICADSDCGKILLDNFKVDMLIFGVDGREKAFNC
jgi:hypothetical protein